MKQTQSHKNYRKIYPITYNDTFLRSKKLNVSQNKRKLEHKKIIQVIGEEQFNGMKISRFTNIHIPHWLYVQWVLFSSWFVSLCRIQFVSDYNFWNLIFKNSYSMFKPLRDSICLRIISSIHLFVEHFLFVLFIYFWDHLKDKRICNFVFYIVWYVHCM